MERHSVGGNCYSLMPGYCKCHLDGSNCWQIAFCLLLRSFCHCFQLGLTVREACCSLAGSPIHDFLEIFRLPRDHLRSIQAYYTNLDYVLSMRCLCIAVQRRIWLLYIHYFYKYKDCFQIIYGMWFTLDVQL